MIRFVASEWLSGFKIGVFRDDGAVVVSPALFSLLQSEKGPELEHLVNHIDVLQVPDMLGSVCAPLAVGHLPETGKTVRFVRKPITKLERGKEA